MGRLILILGGARSGKSKYAQDIAQQIGRDSVLFVATARAGDEEMKARIEKHRQERSSGWKTLEAPRNIGRAIEDGHDGATAILVDCLTLLVSNRLLEFEDPFSPAAKAAVMAEVQALAHCAQTVQGTILVVSNEVGMGLVPPYPLGRAYRDVLGKANQVLAQAADEAYLLVAGIPLALKGDRAMRSEESQ